MFPNHSNVKCFWYVSFMGIVNNTSLGSTLAIQTSFFIILNTSRIDSILKCLYTTKSFKYFKFRINLKIPLFFFLVKTVEIKSTDSFEASTITLFLRRNLISVVIISCSETQWGIWGTFRFPGILEKSILSLFSFIPTIKESLVMSFQSSIKFLMLLAINLVFAIFYQIFIFSPNDSSLKTMKNVFSNLFCELKSD